MKHELLKQKKKVDKPGGAEHRQGDFRWRFRATGSIRLVAYDGADANVEIPDNIHGMKITSLAANLFKDNKTLESVSIPDSVCFLGHHVFAGCSNLRKIRLSAGVEQMPVTTFAKCERLEEVVFTAPVVTIENGLFADAPVRRAVLGADVCALEEKPLNLPYLEEVAVDVANPLFTTDSSALFAYEGQVLYRLVVPREEYAVPEGCVTINERAFDSLAQLKRVTLPQTLHSIGRLAFAKTALGAMVFPRSVELIGEKAFFHCTKLTSVTFVPGVKTIEEDAFAFSALQQVALPATLRELGFHAFDHTPAQKRIPERAFTISPENRYLELDAEGGLYRNNEFVELIGLPQAYRVRSGTRRIARGAFKRHATVRFVEIPEGVHTLGAEAFKNDRQLHRVDLPESLECIGERAFLDCGVETLYLSKNVREIGDNALLTQGENQLTPRTPLQGLDLSPENPVFYLENGLLCQHDGNKAGGDSLIVYVGPDHIVRIPPRVTKICNLAFCGVSGIDELYVHAHLQSICIGAFAVGRSIPLMHVEFPEPIEGCTQETFHVPSLSSRFRSQGYLLDTYFKGTYFDFEYYDSWVTHTTNLAEFAPAGLGRLKNPIRMSEYTMERYKGIFRRQAQRVCRLFAGVGNLEALEWLCENDLLSMEVIEEELKASSQEGRTQATACLLELQHRNKPSVGVDFSL